MEKELAKPKLLISACLMGENVKYNGGNNLIDLKDLKNRYELVPFCPEVAGGLPTPRSPSEILSHEPLRVVDIDGRDVTREFERGARLCLELAQREDITKALLKSNSPSCSATMIYDGSFGSRLVKGKGVTATLLSKYGIKVLDDRDKNLDI